MKLQSITSLLSIPSLSLNACSKNETTQQNIASSACARTRPLYHRRHRVFPANHHHCTHTQKATIRDMRLCSFSVHSIHGPRPVVPSHTFFIQSKIQPDQEKSVSCRASCSPFDPSSSSKTPKKCVSSVSKTQFPSRIAYRSAFRNGYRCPSGMGPSILGVFRCEKRTFFPRRE